MICNRCGASITPRGMTAHQKRPGCVVVYARKSIFAAGYERFAIYYMPSDLMPAHYEDLIIVKGPINHLRLVKDTYRRGGWGHRARTGSNWYIKPSYNTIIHCPQLSVQERQALRVIAEDDPRYQTALAFAELMELKK